MGMGLYYSTLRFRGVSQPTAACGGNREGGEAQELALFERALSSDEKCLVPRGRWFEPNRGSHTRSRPIGLLFVFYYEWADLSDIRFFEQTLMIPDSQDDYTWIWDIHHETVDDMNQFLVKGNDNMYVTACPRTPLPPACA
jgi:hypothetical protein